MYLTRRASLSLLQVVRNGPESILASSALPIVKRTKEANRRLSYYRPIYSIHSSQNNLVDVYQKRFANTSSGFYAPSTMVTGSCRSKESSQDSRATSSVCEDNEHLPPLPVPDLNLTLEKLKESISPMAMNSAEFVSTLELIDEFSRSAGPKFDLLLRNKANQTKNWITHDWWLNEIYLKSRSSLMINSNPAMIYPEFPFQIDNQQKFLRTASLIISGVIDYQLALIQGYNPEATSVEDEFHLYSNICYNQYRHVFGSIRVPGETSDQMIMKDLADSSLDKPISIVVSYRGKFFELKLNNLENEDDRIERLISILGKIISCAEVSEDTDGVGILTTTKRDQWAQAFKLLDPESIDVMTGAQFLVSLEMIPSNSSDQHSSQILSNHPSSDEYKGSLCRQILHSDGANVGNRWFDKTLQLIIVADEKGENYLGAGVNYEHTLAEAAVVSKLIEYSYDRAVQKHRAMSNLDLSSKQTYHGTEVELRKLSMFNSTNVEPIEALMKQARQDYSAQVDQFDLVYMNYKGYGSNAIKSWRFSPDSWFQVALQLGYYELHKRLGACYESASTRRFAHGRTETIRSLTKEVAQFCYEPNYETMQAAIKSHKSYANAANNAEAIDRVLMGYRMVFNELRDNDWRWGINLGATSERVQTGIDRQAQLQELFDENELSTIVAFFRNELIKRSKKFSLSTSQVSSIHPNIVMSYGPLLADGYGCCYNISGQRITASITANSSNQSFSCEANRLHESLQESLNRMRDIVEQQ